MRIIILMILFVISTTIAQSVLTLQPGTSMGVTTGADLCSNIFNGSNLFYGGGTMCGGLVAIDPVNSNELPAIFDVQQNYPNPFNPVTVIKYQVPKSTYISIKLYDQLGREALALFEGEESAGYYQLTVDGTNLASGIYYCRINAADYTKVIKMSLIK